MPVPDMDHWHCNELGFFTGWNFPDCTGEIDGKHVVLQAPNKSASLYHNYKGTFSVVLMAILDPWYRFTCIDIGDYRSNADGAMWSRQAFWTGIGAWRIGLAPYQTTSSTGLQVVCFHMSL